MKINNNHLGSLPHLFSNTDELVRLHGEGTESNVGCIDPNTCELYNKKQQKKLILIPLITLNCTTMIKTYNTIICDSTQKVFLE